MSKIQYILQGPENAKETGIYSGALYLDIDKNLIKGWGSYYTNVHELPAEAPNGKGKLEHGAIMQIVKEEFLNKNNRTIVSMLQSAGVHSSAKPIEIVNYDAPAGTLEMLDNLKYQNRYNLKMDNPPQ